jgi:DNA-binding GntR family transcriptional regulator
VKSDPRDDIFSVPRPPSQAGSLTQTAYERLRHDLMTGRLKPGERLKINDLCGAMGLNLSAVREALARLTSEGLVTSEPQRGFRAAPISPAELMDLTKTRIEIESLCLRRAIELGDIIWESNILAAYHALSHTKRPGFPEPGQAAAWSGFHAAFHAQLCAACDSAWLLRIRELLFSQSERYRMLVSGQPGLGRNVDEEHKRIMDAVLARQASEACTLMASHFELTARHLLAAYPPGG